jgi:hypothetical protein
MGEVRGFLSRAEHMLAIAEGALADVALPDDTPGLRRFIRREPLGVVLVIAPWKCVRSRVTVAGCAADIRSPTAIRTSRR